MLNFPTSPTSGDYYSFGVRTWQWNNSAWVIIDGAINASTLSGRDLNYILDAGNMTGTYTGVVSGSVTTGQVVNLEEFVEDTIGINFILFGTGLSGTYNDAGNTFTISGKYASTTEHGVARFSSSDFTVTGGLVTVNDGGINIVSTQVSDFTEAVQDTVGSPSFLLSSNGVTGIYNDTANTLTLSGINATTTTRGVASFNSTYFTVSNGAVSLGTVPLASIEENTGPYILGATSVGLGTSPFALSPSSVEGILTGLSTVSSFNFLSGRTNSHINDSSIHFTEASIDHSNIQSIGVYLHDDIDYHIDNSSNPHSVTAAQVGAPTIVNFSYLSGLFNTHLTNTDAHPNTFIKKFPGASDNNSIKPTKTNTYPLIISGFDKSVDLFSSYDNNGIKGFYITPSGQAAWTGSPSATYHITNKNYVDNISGYITGLSLQKNNNLIDIPNLDMARQNLYVDYLIEDFMPLNNNSWGSSTAGNGNTYQKNPAFLPFGCSGADVNGIVAVGPGAGTTVGDASIRYSNNAGDYFSANRVTYFRIAYQQTGNMYVRFGVFNVVPSSATGKPADGAYFEYNSAYGTGMRVFVASASSYTSGTSTNMFINSTGWIWYGIEGKADATYFYDFTYNKTYALTGTQPVGSLRVMRPFLQSQGNGTTFNEVLCDKIMWKSPISSMITGLLR